MIRIPLARRLIASADATWLIGQFARLWCGDYLARIPAVATSQDNVPKKMPAPSAPSPKATKAEDQVKAAKRDSILTPKANN